MQVNEIKERFTHFEESVHEALRTCQQEGNVSPQLANDIRNLDREVLRAHEMICNAQQESPELIECIDHLEEMGDDAKRSCQSEANISQAMRDTVLDLHKEISTLKHQLH